MDHPLQTNTREFLQVSLPFFPKYTYYHSNPNNDQPNYVNENAIFSTLSWTSYYHFSNPLSLPLYNNPDDNKLCQTRLYHLNTALHEKQFTTIGLNQRLNRFTARKANRFSINHYNHAIELPNEDIFSNDDTNAKPQLTETFFIKCSYVFTINCLNKKIRPHNIRSTSRHKSLRLLFQ